MRYFECPVCGSELYSCGAFLEENILGGICIGIRSEHFYTFRDIEFRDIYNVLTNELSYLNNYGIKGHPPWTMEEKNNGI